MSVEYGVIESSSTDNLSYGPSTEKQALEWIESKRQDPQTAKANYVLVQRVVGSWHAFYMANDGPHTADYSTGE